MNTDKEGNYCFEFYNNNKLFEKYSPGFHHINFPTEGTASCIINLPKNYERNLKKIDNQFIKRFELLGDSIYHEKTGYKDKLHYSWDEKGLLSLDIGSGVHGINRSSFFGEYDMFQFQNMGNKVSAEPLRDIVLEYCKLLK